MSRVIKIKKILVSSSAVEKIMSIWGCSKATVYNALAFRSKSKLASEIRNAALNSYGGVEKTIPVMID